MQLGDTTLKPISLDELRGLPDVQYGAYFDLRFFGLTGRDIYENDVRSLRTLGELDNHIKSKGVVYNYLDLDQENKPLFNILVTACDLPMNGSPCPLKVTLTCLRDLDKLHGYVELLRTHVGYDKVGAILHIYDDQGDRTYSIFYYGLKFKENSIHFDGSNNGAAQMCLEFEQAWNKLLG